MLLEPLLFPVWPNEVSDPKSPVVPYLAQHLERLSCTTYLFLSHWIAYWIGCQSTFSRQEKRKNLLAKKKRRFLLARLKPLLEMGQNKQRIFITTRIPKQRVKRNSRGSAGVSGLCVRRLSFQCDLRRVPLLICVSVSSSVKGARGGRETDCLSLSGDESKRT